jgi:hypothetical protein
MFMLALRERRSAGHLAAQSRRGCLEHLLHSAMPRLKLLEGQRGMDLLA